MALPTGQLRQVQMPRSEPLLVGRVRVERTSSDFQSGAPTLYATDPYKILDAI